jgi:extracellular elastinolytic metalloproteinase
MNLGEGTGEVFVDAQDGSIVDLINFTAHASYRAIPLGQQYSSGAFTLISNPENLSASPNGWVTNRTTSGNNVIGLLAYSTLQA